MNSVAAAMVVAQVSAGPAPGLHPRHLYNGAGQPMLIDVIGTQPEAVVDLVLMDDAGSVLVIPRGTGQGAIDLAQAMPAAIEAIREREGAAYLQMVVDGEPIGSALVLQPMLSRLVPVTEVAPHPTRGHPHTRIIGWQVEQEGPPGETPPAPRPRVFTGLRIYVEQDVLLRTTHGEIVVALRPDRAPNTAWNFRELARGGFYRGVSFHRIVPVTRQGEPFVIQAGDPSATGDGGPGFWLPIEPSELPHDFGVISMARADDPDSAGSQFFFCLSREGTARLDGQYCSFGYAVSGAETILSIAGTPLADVALGRPEDPPMIMEAVLLPGPPRTPGRGRPDGRVQRPAAPQVDPGRIPR